MAFTHVTAAKLAAHFNVTAPAMRKALIQRELLDDFLNAPTAEGHLLADAYYVERSSPDFQRFPVWSIDKISELFPEFSEKFEDRNDLVFSSRFAAINALDLAGSLLFGEFEDDDQDIQWLMYEHGGSLLRTSESAQKKKFAHVVLRPMIERLSLKVRRQRRGKKGDVVQALKLLRGVHDWASGKAPQVSSPPHEPFTIAPSFVDRNHTEKGFNITDQEHKLLKAGFVFSPNFSPSPMPCLAEHVITEIFPDIQHISMDDLCFRLLEKHDARFIIAHSYDCPDCAEPAKWIDAKDVYAAHEISIDDDLRISFIGAVDATGYKEEIHQIQPDFTRNFSKSRYARRLQIEISQSEGKIAEALRSLYDVLQEGHEAMKL